MARGVPQLRRSFTFGGRVPAGVGALLVAMLVASAISWMSPTLGSLLVLHPVALAELQVWRLVTWAFVQPHPLTLVFVGMMLWWLGQQLSYEWSERRFLARFLGLAVGAGAITALVGILWPPAAAPHVGGWTVVLALLFAWGLMHPAAELRWFGIVPLTGRWIANIVLFGTVLWALFEGRGSRAGIGEYVPNFAAIAIAWAQLNSRGGSRRWWTGVKRRWSDWRFERRSRHLKVVRRRNGEDEDRPRWMN
jgi:membrane associated rhomboid family serine protease